MLRLTQIYEEGERTRTKMSPQQAVQQLKDSRNIDGTRTFAPEIIPNWRYVAGFFGRMANKKRKNKK